MFKAIKKLKTFNKLPQEQRRFVFFSESSNYYPTFSPIIREFRKRAIPFTYLSMDAADPGLELAAEAGISTFCLGSGVGFLYFMGMIKADVVVMTTPGLQSLSLKRSPGAAHYVHIVHAPAGISSYRKYSFDHFDTVMCSGPHQIDEIRRLERRRGTREKKLLKTGCAYMDVLKERLERVGGSKRGCSGKITALAAPTWGRNGALWRFGMALLTPLLDAGFQVIIRPHPQQIKSERSLIESLKRETASCGGIRWDHNSSGHDSMIASDIMISDLSGVIFDYAFIYEKPVITLDFPLETKGYEREDLPGLIWDLEIRKKLGIVVSAGELPRLAGAVKDLLLDGTFVGEIRKIRETALFHFGCVGKTAADQLVEIAKTLTK